MYDAWNAESGWMKAYNCIRLHDSWSSESHSLYYLVKTADYTIGKNNNQVDFQYKTQVHIRYVGY